MPNVESHAPGNFCWVELATSDQAGAKKFYRSLFVWEADASPWAPARPIPCSRRRPGAPPPDIG
jgi:predicted enzyme related to lactoylglutathione lyase